MNFTMLRWVSISFVRAGRVAIAFPFGDLSGADITEADLELDVRQDTAVVTVVGVF